MLIDGVRRTNEVMRQVRVMGSHQNTKNRSREVRNFNILKPRIPLESPNSSYDVDRHHNAQSSDVDGEDDNIENCETEDGCTCDDGSDMVETNFWKFELISQ